MVKKSSAKHTPPKPPKSKAPNLRRAMEQTMLEIARLLEEKELDNLDEANAFLATLSGSNLHKMPRRTPSLSAREEAQELAYDAMEAPTEGKARSLAKRALVKDPDCIDALVALTGLDTNSPKQAIEGLQRAVAAGERSLGAAFFKENKGLFWGLLETRPYMRARQQLAEMLNEVGLHQDAISHYKEMLELNPNDNQGVREPLLALYLQTNDSNGARKLLKKYRHDASATFAWGRVLERTLAGDVEAAAAALKTARKENPFVELYMTAQRPFPKEIPGYYAMGSAEEAVLSLESLAPAWTVHPEAMVWLLTQLHDEPPEKKPPPRAQRGSRPLPAPGS